MFSIVRIHGTNRHGSVGVGLKVTFVVLLADELLFTLRCVIHDFWLSHLHVKLLIYLYLNVERKKKEKEEKHSLSTHGVSIH